MLHIFLYYVNFECQAAKDVCNGNLPEYIFDASGIPISDNLQLSEEYDIVALRLIAVGKIYRLFKTNRSEPLLENILFGDTIIKYIEIICVVYDIPCFDMWGINYGVHYSNVKLYEMALEAFSILINKVDFYKRYMYKLKETINSTLLEIRYLLDKFNYRLSVNGHVYDVIIPTLSSVPDKEYSLVDVRPSVLFPYLPIFKKFSTITDMRLINVAIIVLSFNDLEFESTGTIPFIWRNNNYSHHKNVYKCIISSISTYRGCFI